MENNEIGNYRRSLTPNKVSLCYTKENCSWEYEYEVQSNRSICFGTVMINSDGFSDNNTQTATD